MIDPGDLGPSEIDANLWPTAVPYARPVTVARFAEPYLNPHLMKPGPAVVDAVLMLGTAIVAIVAIGTAVGTGLLRVPHEYEIIIQPITAGPVSLVVLAMILWRRGQNHRAVGLGWMPPGAALGWGVLAMIGGFVMSALLGMLVLAFREGAVQNIIREKERMMTMLAPTPKIWILPVTMIVGLYEELIVRGLLMSRLTVVFKRTTIPIIISSAIFGILHFGQGPFGMAQTFCLGLLLASLAAWRRNIWPCIIAHTLVDTLALLFVTTLGPKLQDILHSASQPAL